MVLRNGATASIGSTSPVRKLTMPFAKYKITAYGTGIALNGMTFMQSFVKINQLLPTLNEGQTVLFTLREGLWAAKGTTIGFKTKLQFTATTKVN